MINRRARCLILIGSAFAAFSPVLAGPAGGERIPKLIQLSGSAYERGLEHGKQIRQQIAKIVELWKAELC